MNNLQISIAKAEDGEGVAEVFHKTWLVTYPNKEAGITTDDIEEFFRKRREERKDSGNNRIKNPPKGEILLIAKEGAKVVGVCRLVVKEDRNQLQAIYVLPECQGNGIGRQFWIEMQKYFDPNKDIYVEVATYNAKAIAFYQKLGFTDTGKRMKDERFKMKSGNTIPEMEMVLRR